MCIEWALWMYRGFTETKETSRRASMYRGISHSTLYTCKEISLYTCSWVRIPLYMQCIHEYLEVSLYMPLYIQRDIPLCMFVGSYPSIHAMYRWISRGLFGLFEASMHAKRCLHICHPSSLCCSAWMYIGPSLNIGLFWQSMRLFW